MMLSSVCGVIKSFSVNYPMYLMVRTVDSLLYANHGLEFNLFSF